MKENKRLYISPYVPYTPNINRKIPKDSDYFRYKPPNNSGVILGIIGGALAALGDVLATIGAIIQLDIDVNADFQSQIEAFKSEQEKDKMREQIDDLKEQVKEIENLKEQLKQLEEKIKETQD